MAVLTSLKQLRLPPEPTSDRGTARENDGLDKLSLTATQVISHSLTAKPLNPRQQVCAISDQYEWVKPNHVRSTCPIKIPPEAEISHPRNNNGNVKMEAGYRNISFSWKEGDQLYIARWHTKTRADLAEDRPTWRVTRMNAENRDCDVMELVSCDGEKIWFPKEVFKALLAITCRREHFANSANPNLRGMAHFAEETVRAGHFVDIRTLPRKKANSWG